MCGSCCTWLAVWQFIKSYWYDIGDAIAQLIDFGTDINNINVYSQACHQFKTNFSTFNESLQFYQKENSNETESGSDWSNQMKDYVTNLLGGDSDDWPMLDKYICQRRQCGYFYASIPPMIIPSLIMLGFVLANKRTRQLLDSWKILFILFSQITVPIYTLYLICRNQYKDELYQTLYALCTFLYIGESIPELIINIFYLGENGGFIAKNWLLLLSAAFSIEQTLYGMSFGFSALYNLGKQQYLAKLSKSQEETRQRLELLDATELLKPEEVA